MKSIIILLMVLCFPTLIFAEIVVLKSGKTVEGEIVERTGEYIKINLRGIPITYFLDQIETIKPAKPEVPEPFFKTIKITYKTVLKILDANNNVITEDEGSKIVYIDAVNNKRRDEVVTKMKMGPMKVKQGQLRIFDGKKEYYVHPDANVAQYYDNIKPEDIHVWIDDFALVSYEDNENILYLGEGQVLGRTCKVYDIGGMKFWNWNTLTLKMEQRMEGMLNLEEATDIEENIIIDSKKFELPEGISVKSFDEVLFDSIKRPEKVKR